MSDPFRLDDITDADTCSVQGATPDGMPHVGKVPGKQAQYILAGFNGGGNALTFLSAKAITAMVLEDVPLGDTGVGVPQFFEPTEQRLNRRVPPHLAIELDIRH